MKWLCTDKSGTKKLVVACQGYVTAFEAGAFAIRYAKFRDAPIVTAVGEDAVEDVWIRWEGNDAGSRPNRRIQLRRPGSEEWVDL